MRSEVHWFRGTPACEITSLANRSSADDFDCIVIVVDSAKSLGICLAVCGYRIHRTNYDTWAIAGQIRTSFGWRKSKQVCEVDDRARFPLAWSWRHLKCRP